MNCQSYSVGRKYSHMHRKRLRTKRNELAAATDELVMMPDKSAAVRMNW